MKREPINEPTIDWFRIFCDLKSAGYSLGSISYFTGVLRSTLHGIKMGAEPRFTTGQRILRFWSQALVRNIEDAPRIDPYSHKA